jgi:hypothetical protein
MTPSSSPRSSAQHAGRGEATQIYPTRGPDQIGHQIRGARHQPSHRRRANRIRCGHADDGVARRRAGWRKAQMAHVALAVDTARPVRQGVVVLSAPDNNRPIVVGSRRCRHTTQYLGIHQSPRRRRRGGQTMDLVGIPHRPTAETRGAGRISRVLIDRGRPRAARSAGADSGRIRIAVARQRAFARLDIRNEETVPYTYTFEDIRHRPVAVIGTHP